ncbi:hypothetical protein LTR53_016342 [Teratosphaeriaceae sp. CCFEE 6253]|nr:hypothetical protein LTR53_016342 [Teratosphaeriaceae sp. CCFEE 6253]
MEHGLTEVTSKAHSNTLGFSSGEQAQAAIVVGADGVHSQVRKSGVTAQTVLKVLPFAAYYGRRRVSIETFDSTYEPYMNQTTIVEHKSGQTLLRIAVDEVTDNYVGLSYTFSRPARQHDPLFKSERPNSGAKEIPDELYSEVASLSGLVGPFKDVFDPAKMRNDRILNWLMRSATVSRADLHGAAEKGITLIGDAVRATPILGGSGANAAIVDGVELAAYIAENGTGSLSEFYDGRYSAWEKEVKASEDKLAEMHLDLKPSL